MAAPLFACYVWPRPHLVSSSSIDVRSGPLQSLSKAKCMPSRVSKPFLPPRPLARGRVPRVRAAAGDKAESLWDQLRSSTRFGEGATHVASWKLAAFAALGTAASLGTFNVLAACIAASSAEAGFAGPPGSLLFPDLHFGYGPTEIAGLLGDYGHAGRLWYLLVEAVDVLFYHTSYRALFLVLLNSVASAAESAVPKPGRPLLRYAAQAPIFVAALDGFEDVGQVALTLAYDVTNGGAAEAAWWPLLAATSSVFNVAKWTAVRTFSPLAALLGVVAVLAPRGGGAMNGGDGGRKELSRGIE